MDSMTCTHSEISSIETHKKSQILEERIHTFFSEIKKNFNSEFFFNCNNEPIENIPIKYLKHP